MRMLGGRVTTPSSNHAMFWASVSQQRSRRSTACREKLTAELTAMRPAERSSGGRLFYLAPRQSLQRHGNNPELLALCERHIGGGAAVLQRRCDADCAEASVASQGLLHRCPKGPLRLGHCRALAMRGGVVFAFCNRFGLDDLTGVVVYDHLEELPVLHRVNGELQLAFLHLELGGNRLAVTGARRQTTLEGHRSVHDGFCQCTLAAFPF